MGNAYDELDMYDGHGDIRAEAKGPPPDAAGLTAARARQAALDTMHECHRQGIPFRVESGAEPIPPGPHAGARFAAEYEDFVRRSRWRRTPPRQNDAPAQEA